MVDSASTVYGFSSSIIWLAMIVIACGVLGFAMVLLLKNALRRRVPGVSNGAERPTKVHDAWAESAKRMDGRS